MLKKLIALAFSCVCVVTAQADDAAVKKTAENALQGVFGNQFKVEAIRKTPALGLYELTVGGEIVYMDEKARYLIMGDIIDIKAKQNLTEERKKTMSGIKFSDLPLDLAIKQVKGNGKRVIATFEDPNCGYCKRLAKELVGISDVTVYTFLYPILSQDSVDKSQNIWCAADKAKAWNDWMVNGTAPAAAKCDNPVQKTLAFGQKLNIRGTPTMFFADGSRAPGYMPAAQLEQALAKAAK